MTADAGDSADRHMDRLLNGPSLKDREIMLMVDDFFRYLTLQIFRNAMTPIPLDKRKEICTDMVDKWKRRIRRNVNSVVQVHEEVLRSSADKVPPTVGDGEDMRLQSDKCLTEAVVLIGRWLSNAVEGLPDGAEL